MSFLNAEWRKLILANYHINPSLLTEHLPFGTQLDLWKGKCYVSLVGFMFVNTRVLGIKVPFHVNFEEVNLRFYVKRFENNQWKRGVVFIKEIVPKPAITFVANTLYRENYETLPMKHQWLETSAERQIEYSWKKQNQWNKLKVNTLTLAQEITLGSEAEFITEHYWGYARKNLVSTNEYEVTHPRWLQYIVLEYEIAVDFGSNYGQQFDFLSEQEPISVFLAEGSEITVEPKSKILKS